MSIERKSASDVALIGAGPIGLEMAVALKRAGIDYLHFDARQIGYTISWFAPQTRFFSSNERIAIAGVPLQSSSQNKSTREEYLAYLRSVVELFDLQIQTYEPVKAIEGSAQRGFDLTTLPASGTRHYRARKIILATGGTDRPRRLGVPGEDLPHVSHYFDEPHKYFRKRVLVIGGKNSAAEAALRCHHAGAHVSISYRRAALPHKSIKYWLLPEMNGLIESGRMPAYFGTLPACIGPGYVDLIPSDASDGAMTRVGATGRRVDADFVLALIGYEADVSLCRAAGVEMRGDCHAPVYDEQTMETNVPGIFVAGTATAGTQDKYAVFIENCHVHVERIIAALTGSAAPGAPRFFAQPES